MLWTAYHKCATHFWLFSHHENRYFNARADVILWYMLLFGFLPLTGFCRCSVCKCVFVWMWVCVWVCVFVRLCITQVAINCCTMKQLCGVIFAFRLHATQQLKIICLIICCYADWSNFSLHNNIILNLDNSFNSFSCLLLHILLLCESISLQTVKLENQGPLKAV